MSEPTVLSRRTLLRGAAAGGALIALGSVAPVSAAPPDAALPRGATVLFQGDSITDGGRDRKVKLANDLKALGRSYPTILGGALLGSHPELTLRIHNRGISGNKVPDLERRWKEDAIDLDPDLLSILIGVNDIWHKLNGSYDGTVADYETGYRALLERTRKELPKTRIVICEPFVLRTGAVNDHWFPEFDERRAVARKLADELQLTFVPFQTMFDEAIQSAPAGFWAGDGVHPSLAGHALMAATWRKTVGI